MKDHGAPLETTVSPFSVASPSGVTELLIDLLFTRFWEQRATGSTSLASEAVSGAGVSWSYLMLLCVLSLSSHV
ncbi:hypothetical protein AOLI_G00247310 [Acnodon oligacanthus]